MTFAIARRAAGSLSAPKTARQQNYACRRIFDNGQLVERFDAWLQVIGKSAHTRTAYVFAAKQFARFLVDKPLNAATKEDIRSHLGELHGRGFTGATMALRLFGLRSLYDFLQLGNQVNASTPRFIQARRLPKRLPHAKSEEEIEQLIAAAGTPRDRAILELGYASALRVSELANLRVEDVNIRARSLIVRHGKGGNDRVGLFGRPAAAALREYLGDRLAGFLFQPLPPRRQRGGVWMDRYHIWFGQWRETDENGKRVMRTVRLGDYELSTKERARAALDAYLADKLPCGERESPQRRLTTKQLWRVVVNAAKRAGLTEVHPHTLRHSAATHCLNHGMDIRFVQELLGHTSLVATQKYLHVAVANLQRTHAKFHPHGGKS